MLATWPTSQTYQLNTDPHTHTASYFTHALRVVSDSLFEFFLMQTMIISICKDSSPDLTLRQLVSPADGMTPELLYQLGNQGHSSQMQLCWSTPHGDASSLEENNLETATDMKRNETLGSHSCTAVQTKSREIPVWSIMGNCFKGNGIWRTLKADI